MTRKDPDAKVWGVWLEPKPGNGATPDWAWSGGSRMERTHAEAVEIAASMVVAWAAWTPSARRLDDPSPGVVAETSASATLTVLTLTPGGLDRVAPDSALYVDVADLARLLFEGDPDVMRLVAEKSDGREDRLQGARDRAWELDALGKRAHYEALVGGMLARWDPAGVAL